MRWPLLFVLAAPPLLGGCLFAPVCSAQQPILSADGGSYRCVKAEDCPRPGNILICTSTGDHSGDCVDCVSTTCQRYFCDAGTGP